MNEPAITWTSMLLLLGFAQGLILALLLARSGANNRTAKRMLIALLLLMCVGLAEGFMDESRYYLRFPHLITVEWPSNLLYGPFVYFVVRSFTDPAWRLKLWVALAHALPTVGMYFLLLPFYALTAEQKIHFWKLEGTEPLAHPLVVMIILQMAVYLYVSLMRLATHGRMVKDTYSYEEEVSLSWLRHLLIAFFLLWVVYVFFLLISPFYGIYRETEFILHLLLAIVITVMGYKGKQQPVVFAGGLKSSLPASPAGQTAAPVAAPLESPVIMPGSEEAATEKYQRSSLEETEAEHIAQAVKRIMEQERPYREMKLTLPMLARMLSVSPNHLSQVLNEKLNTSFFDFVNAYRVEEARKLLIAPSYNHFSVLGVAMEVGFNSKSTFYAAFKKHSGMTPSQFKERKFDN